MATVYKANHIHLDKVVVLKMLHTEGLSDRAMVRFHKEAKILSQLNHPNISPFFDFGLSEDNIPYLAIEFLQGETLKDRLKAESYLELEESLSIALDLAGALAHAHAKGIVHRDVKPANVMVTETDGSPRAVLMDFGIARLMETDEEDQSLTSSGELIGSPRYMSPEQGESGKTIDARTDQYSLGCLIFEMLTGNVPLSGDTAFDTIKMRQTLEAPRLSDMSIAEIPESLDDLVAKLLARVPDNRFASMKEVAAIMENLLDEIAANAAEEGEEKEKKDAPLLNVWAPDIQELLRARKIQLALAGTLGMAALLLAGNIFFTSTQSPKQRIPVKYSPLSVPPELSIGEPERIHRNSEEFDIRTAADLTKLAEAKDLQLIKIRNAGSIDLDNLSSLRDHDNLIELYLRPNSYQFKNLDNIAGLKNLLFLEIRGMPLKDELLEALRKSESIQVLLITDCGLTPASAKYLKRLKELKTLHVDNQLLDSPEYKQLSKELPDCEIVGANTLEVDNDAKKYLSLEELEGNDAIQFKNTITKEVRKIGSPLREFEKKHLDVLNKLPATAKDTLNKKMALFEKCKEQAIKAQGPDCSAAHRYMREIAAVQYLSGDIDTSLNTIKSIERSIAKEGYKSEEVPTLSLKSDILWVAGKQKESLEVVEKALPLAKQRQLHQRFTVLDLLERLVTRYGILSDWKNMDKSIDQLISWLDAWHEKREEGYGHYLIWPLRFNCDQAARNTEAVEKESRTKKVHEIGNKIVDWYIGLGGDNRHGKMFLQQKTYDIYIETEARLATFTPDIKGQIEHLEKAYQAIGNATGLETRNPLLCYQCFTTLGRLYRLENKKERAFALFEKARKLLPVLPPRFRKKALEQIDNEVKVLKDG